MSRPLLLVVTGPPASGKTSVAEGLASELGLPLLTKDLIKETLFDTLGWGGSERSKELGAASFALLHRVVDRLVAAGTAVVVEANFEARSAEELSRLDARLLQVYCTAPEAELVRRFAERDRHPGHEDDTYDLSAALADDRWPVLALDAPLVRLDTSSTPDLGPILALAR